MQTELTGTIISSLVTTAYELFFLLFNEVDDTVGRLSHRYL